MGSTTWQEQCFGQTKQVIEHTSTTQFDKSNDELEDKHQWLQHDTYDLDLDLGHWHKVIINSTYRINVHTLDREGQLDKKLNTPLENILNLTEKETTDNPDTQ